MVAIVPGLVYRKTLELRLGSSGGAKGFGAFGAGADVAEMVVAVDAGGVAISKADLNGVVAHLRSGLGARLGLEHRQRGR